MDPLRKGIAIGMLFGSGKEPELNDKEVEIDVSDILDALTGIFTYNPEDEDPQGDPPGPWDGYSLFTIDLTAVKQSLEDIIEALQQHDPDYDPDETPPEDAVEDLIEENEQQEQTIEDLTEQVEECDQCKADVIAKLQEYDPDFDPQTCKDIPPEIDEIVDKNKGVVVPDGVDPAPIALALDGAVTDDDIHASAQIVCRVSTYPDVYVEKSKITRPPYIVFHPFVKVTYIDDGEQITDYLPLTGSYGLNTDGDYGEITSWSVASADGTITANGVWHTISAGGTFDIPITGSITISQLVGWGDTGHTQRITN